MADDDLDPIKAGLEVQLGDGNGQLQDAVEDTKKMLEFAHLARESFISGDDDTKRQIVMTIGSNLTLIDRKLRIQAQKPFQIIEESLLGSEGAPKGFERGEKGPESTQSGPFGVGLCAGLGIRDDVRTWSWGCAVRGIIRFLQKESPRFRVPSLGQHEARKVNRDGSKGTASRGSGKDAVLAS